MSLRVLQYSDVENACDDPERIGRLAGTIRARRDDGTVVVGTGDNTAPGVLPLVTNGTQALEFYEAIEPDVATFGNHDFDFGPDATLEIVERSPQTWLSANVRQNGGAFGADVGVEPWTVLDCAGVRAGFTGVTTQRIASQNPMATDLTFRDPIPAVREAIAELRARDVDVVVVCSHLGRGDDELARRTDADVVLGGHVPSTRLETVDGTLLTRPGDGGRAVVEVTLTAGDEPSAALHSTREFARAPDVVDAFERLTAAAGLDEVVAHVDAPIERTEATLFGGESRVGNVVADAYRWKTGADVALQNSGGIRSGPPLEGEVTAADLISLVPFDEPLGVAAVSGARLEAIVDDAAGIDLGFAEPDWWHAHVSGAVLEWDETTHDVTIREVGGEPFDPDATYHLATSNYLFATTDEFGTLEPEDRVRTLSEPQFDVILEYARAHDIDPMITGRIRRIN
ncbi:5'-nucleotidase C-terminal domain-containing protein [Halomontanus rarus]|uniref:5'-nucleotidase C-terminal domain-containing protein n=1 Tax=Halomontanus rarus TaxID=3034020 RepID=UPI001A99464B